MTLNSSKPDKQKDKISELMNLISLTLSVLFFVVAYNLTENLLLFFIISFPILWVIAKLINNNFVKQKLVYLSGKFSIRFMYVTYFVVYVVLFSAITRVF